MVSNTTKQKYNDAGPGVTRAIGVWNALIKIIMTKISIIDQRPTASVMRYSRDMRWMGMGKPKWAEAISVAIEMIFKLGSQREYVGEFIKSA